MSMNGRIGVGERSAGKAPPATNAKTPHQTAARMLAPQQRERVQMESDTLDLVMNGEPRCVEASLVCGAPRFTLQLNLSNHGDLPLGFKAMTNAPRRWSVKPNGGVVDPGSTVQIVLSLITARAKESFANDHHLMLTLPLQPEDVARLLQLRSAENGRVSIPSLTQDNPRVSQVRLSPQLPQPQPGLEKVIESPLANGTRADADARAQLGSPSRDISPGAMHGAMHEEVAAAAAGDLSVAERVKDLQRRYGARYGANGASASALEMFAACADPSAASAEADVGSTGGDSADSAPMHPLLRHPLLRRTLRHPLLRWLIKLVGTVLGEDFLDEFEPWLKWKVYDVLFALGVVLLGRRLSRCPRAQRVLDFVSES